MTRYKVEIYCAANGSENHWNNSNLKVVTNWQSREWVLKGIVLCRAECMSSLKQISIVSGIDLLSVE